MLSASAGAAASMDTAPTGRLDYQIGQAQKPRSSAAQEVIDPCWGLGAANTILRYTTSAGGLQRAPEIVHRRARRAVRLARCRRETDVAVQMVQRGAGRYAIAIAPEDLKVFGELCERGADRTRSGRATGDGRLSCPTRHFEQRAGYMELSVPSGASA